MKLDDLEKRARSYRDVCRMTGNTGSVPDTFAKELLEAIPVIRAAQAWRRKTGLDWDLTHRGSAFPCEDRALARAVDAMEDS